MTDEWDRQLQALGSFIRTQRKMANLSLRKAAELAQISNPYLSQLERGMHEPSVRVLQSIARALDISAEALLEQAGLWDGGDRDGDPPVGVESAIRRDPQLTDEQKVALLAVYRSYLAAGGGPDRNGSGTGPAGNGSGRGRGGREAGGDGARQANT
jgi:transcriptional regulator with XRE-family HTH domain